MADIFKTVPDTHVHMHLVLTLVLTLGSHNGTFIWHYHLTSGDLEGHNEFIKFKKNSS